MQTNQMVAAGVRPVRGDNLIFKHTSSLGWVAEFLFLSYYLMSTAFPVMQITLPFLGSGALAVCTVLVCVLNRGFRILSQDSAYRWCVISVIGYLVVELLIHQSSWQGDAYARSIVTWPFMLACTVILAERKGFAIRLCVCTLGACGFYFSNAEIVRNSVYERMQFTLETLNLNDVAGNLGFCFLAFLFSGKRAKNSLQKAILLGLSLVSFVGMVSTVSRGAMVAAAMGLACGLKKKDFNGRNLIVAAICAVGLLIYLASKDVSSLTNTVNSRFLENTGRLDTWPIIIGKCLDSPIVGYGEAELGKYELVSDLEITPHNPFLLYWYVAGALPLVAFMAFWFFSFRDALAARLAGWNDLFGLWIYAFAMVNTSNVYFCSIWCCMAIGLCAAFRRGGNFMRHGRAMPHST